MAVSDWSTTAGSNTSIDGINIGEGCPAGNVNNSLRSIMASVKVMYDGRGVFSGDMTVSGKAQFTTPNDGTTGGIRLTRNATSGNAYLQILDSTATAQTGVFGFNSAGNVNWTGSMTLGSPLGTTSGGTGGSYANAAALIAGIGAQTGCTVTTNANGIAVGIPVGGTTWYIQAGHPTVAGDTRSIGTFPVAFGTEVVGFAATSDWSSSGNSGWAPCGGTPTSLSQYAVFNTDFSPMSVYWIAVGY